MYSESIVNERLEIACNELGYMPEYHSVEEVDRFIANMDKAMKLDSANKPYFSRMLSPAEYRFIENEKILCASDAAYALTRYCWLSDENNNSVRFKFRGSQSILFDVISDLESQRAAIELLIGKGRQVYITTLTQLLVLLRILFHHYTYGVVASADASKAQEMGEKAFFAYDHMPWWLKPRHSRRVEGVPGLLKFDTMDSRLSILHGATSAKVKGGQKVGIARGSTPTVYAISEVAHFANAEQTIEAALFKGVHANPKILGFLESTFASDRGWFAEKYKHAKEYYSQGLSRLRGIFFSWPCSREIYPTPTWWRTNRRHMPPNWEPTGKVLEQINKAEIFIRTSPLYANAKFHTPSCVNESRCQCPTGKDWIMPVEQMWFYNVCWFEAERSGTLGTLLQEMPCDDVEAMQSSFDNVFGRETIEVINAQRERKYDVYGMVGQAIDDPYEPPADEIDYNKPRIGFNHKTPRGDIYRWELIPLKYDLFADAKGEDEEREVINNKLFVYRQPEAGRDYSIGLDSSTGSGHDASVINVNLIGPPGAPDIQAAEFRSHYVGHVEIFAFAMPIALFYRDRQKEVMGWPKIGIEQIASVGDVCQNELKKLGYPAGRFFRFGRYDTVKMKAETNKQGWFTTGWSRPILIGHAVNAIKKGWYVLNSPWTIEECRQFEVHSTAGGKEKLEHSAESWDDGIFASGISYFIVHDMDSLAERSKKQFHGTNDALPLPAISGIDADGRPTRYEGRVFNPSQRQISLDEVVNTMGESNPFRR